MKHCVGTSARHQASLAARRAPWLVVAVLASPVSVTTGAAATSDTRIESLVSTVCQACHMADGNSVVPLFPKLAGQHPEYLAKQLQDILEGKRQNDVMAPILSQFTRADIPGLAAHYARQTPAPGVVRDPALLEMGRRVYEDGNEETGVPSCSGCHEDDGTGNERYPRLAGQHQEYLVQEMSRFRNHSRTNGKYMQAVSERLTDAEIVAVAEYLASLR
jgi:cytochrome c553